MSDEDKQDLRHAVRDVVAVRHPSALTARAIRRSVLNEVVFPVTELDVEAAAELLVSDGQLSVERDPLGITKFYKATVAGVLAYERRGH